MASKHQRGLSKRIGMNIELTPNGWVASSFDANGAGHGDTLPEAASMLRFHQSPYRLIFADLEAIEQFLMHPPESAQVRRMQNFVKALRCVSRQSFAVTRAELATMLSEHSPSRLPWKRRHPQVEDLLSGAIPRNYSVIVDGPHLNREAYAALSSATYDSAVFEWLQYLEHFARIEQLQEWECFVDEEPRFVDALWSQSVVGLHVAAPETLEAVRGFVLVQAPKQTKVELLHEGFDSGSGGPWSTWSHRIRIRKDRESATRALVVPPRSAPKPLSQDRECLPVSRILPLDVAMAGRPPVGTATQALAARELRYA